MTEGAVLVTGAAGFIGSHVAAALLAAGRQVIGVDNFDPYYDRAIKEMAVRGLLRSPRFTFRELDVRDRLGTGAAMHGVTAVIHLAARPGVRQSVEAPDLYRALNEHGTRALLATCADAGVRRLVFSSSSSVYGAGVRTPFREDAPLGLPLSPYAETKQVGERMVRAFVEVVGGQAAIVRLFSVYGPRQRPDLALYRFTSLLREGRPVPILGNGDSQRDYTHVADVAAGIVAAFAWTEGGEGGAACEIFNLGAGHPQRLDWLVSEVARCLGAEARMVVRPAHPADLPVTWADTTKARAVLGFAPRIRLANGIADFVAWFEREHGRQPSPAA